MTQWTVTVKYFKTTGKYYGEGEFKSTGGTIWEILNELRGKLDNDIRPGLVDGKNEYIIIMEVPGHPHDHPTLILPKHLEETQETITELSNALTQIKELTEDFFGGK